MQKPLKSFAGLWNISFGFFGIQIGFALQSANMSRVFQSLGANIDDLAVLWIAAPVTGLLVQPLIGHVSDRTWLGRFGRRRPFFLAGALLSALAMVAMPLSSGLLMAALLLWMLDASLNISMEPFRAFVGDMLNPSQHALGYAVQTAFIGSGAVIGSLFPFALAHFGVANVVAGGGIPDTVRISLQLGAVILFAAVGWTVLTTREYSPDEMAVFHPETATATAPDLTRQPLARAAMWIVAGLATAAVVAHFGLRKEVLLLAMCLIVYGTGLLVAIMRARQGHAPGMFSTILGELAQMPKLMQQLALVQFFTWSALFIMWIHTTPVVAQYVFGAADPASPGYQAAGNWVGVLFAVYNGVAAIASLTLLPLLTRLIGKIRTHALCLTCGAIGYLGFLFVRDAQMLIINEVAIGIAWASILSMPYAILASSLPQAKLGTYMGLFNIFVVIPQLLVATAMGSVMHAAFPGQPIWTMAFAAGSIALAALFTLRIRDVPAAA
ncbi:MFS transporter [Novosphingobium sp.]|uniref:MFS transporter n=1 Tax=Novosphingobium sp. TaxID=1874826 RepID=UPI0033409A52